MCAGRSRPNGAAGRVLRQAPRRRAETRQSQQIISQSEEVKRQGPEGYSIDSFAVGGACPRAAGKFLCPYGGAPRYELSSRPGDAPPGDGAVYYMPPFAC
eukprot:2121357-Pyramimonas_sp.AAC.1